MNVCVWSGGQCASVPVPAGCTTAAQLEAAVAADPSLGLEAGRFRLVRRGLRTEVDDEAVECLVAQENLEAVPRKGDVEEQRVLPSEPAADAYDEEEVQLDSAVDKHAVWLASCALIACFLPGILVLALTGIPPDWEGARTASMDGSVKALCSIARGAASCSVRAEEHCGAQAFGCGAGIAGDEVDVNETTCYVQPGCRGVHFAEPEPSADEFWGLPFGLSLLVMFAFANMLMLCSKEVQRPLRLLRCLRTPCLRAVLMCGFVAPLGLIGFAGYHMHLWSEHVASREAWKDDGRREVCTVVTHPVDSEGRRLNGFGYADVRTELCPRPMRMFLAESEHKGKKCTGGDGTATGKRTCVTITRLSLQLGRQFDCFTKPNCSVEAAVAVEHISSEPVFFLIAQILFVIGWLVAWSYVTYQLFWWHSERH